MRAPSHRNTWQDYLTLSESSTTKLEFFDGEIYAMSGGTPAHAQLAARLIARLDTQLRGKPCRVFTSDLRIRVQETGLTTYPDASVVCGELQYDPTDPHKTVVNPVVLVEVLSDSTEEYDRGTKFEHYQRIQSLREYVLVSQHEPLVEVFHRREGETWTRSEARAGGRLRLGSVPVELWVDELYEGIPLP